MFPLGYSSSSSSFPIHQPLGDDGVDTKKIPPSLSAGPKIRERVILAMEDGRYGPSPARRSGGLVIKDRSSRW